jgi:hypothetical protein
MKAKEYLQQLKRLDELINQKIKEVTDLRERATSVSGIDYSKDKVQTSPSGDAPFVKLIGKIADLEAEINAEIDSFVNEKHKIINQIQSLKNADYISLLFKRYVEFKKFEIIAIEMNFTYQYVLELHGCALREFETTYKNL